MFKEAVFQYVQESNVVNLPDVTINGKTTRSGVIDNLDQYYLQNEPGFQYFQLLPSATVRNSSCGKVMFLQASVILSTEGGCLARGKEGRHSPRQIPPGRHPHEQTPPWADPQQTPPSPSETDTKFDPRYEMMFMYSFTMCLFRCTKINDMRHEVLIDFQFLDLSLYFFQMHCFVF